MINGDFGDDDEEEDDSPDDGESDDGGSSDGGGDNVFTTDGGGDDSEGGGGGGSGGGNTSNSGGGQVLGATTGPTQITGCGTRTTGFSTVTGQSCTNNIAHNEGQVLGAESYHFTLTLKLGSKGTEVMELQKALKAAGYYNGALDGKFGPKVKAAVIKLEIANGLKGDGAVGAKVRALLNK